MPFFIAGLVVGVPKKISRLPAVLVPLKCRW